MSTRCHIAIKLKQEDLGKKLLITENNKEHQLTTNEGFPYMFIYIHHDGCLSGVGHDLLNELGVDYDAVKNYILEGDRTSFTCPYTECNETWEHNKPQFCKSIDGPITEDYLYVLIDGKWFYRAWNDDGRLKELTNEKINGK